MVFRDKNETKKHHETINHNKIATEIRHNRRHLIVLTFISSFKRMQTHFHSNWNEFELAIRDVDDRKYRQYRD
jgi:hypothetical protein